MQDAAEAFTFAAPADPVAATDAVREAAAASTPVDAGLEQFLEGAGTQAFIVIRDDELLYEG